MDGNGSGFSYRVNRREKFENLLKHRIFFADRLEKVEKILLAHNLIPKDQIYCSQEDLDAFNEQFNSDQMSERVYHDILTENEELWFDIYRSITAQSQESIDKESKRS